jgi:hypothetical protein
MVLSRSETIINRGAPMNSICLHSFLALFCSRCCGGGRRRRSSLLCSAWLLLLSSPVTGFFLQQNFACSSNERMMQTAGGTGTGVSARTELGAAPKWERVEREKGRLSRPWKGFIWYKLAGAFQKAQQQQQQECRHDSQFVQQESSPVFCFQAAAGPTNPRNPSLAS